MTRFAPLLVLLAGLCAHPGAAVAQPGPAPIKLLVPTPAGGASDSAARVLAQAWSTSHAHPVVVENRPGAGGVIAIQALLGAPADGRTLLWGLASMSGIPMLQKSAPFQSLGELTPVALVGHLGFGLYVSPELPVRSIADLVAYGKAQPERLSAAYGTLGEYMAATQFAHATGVKPVYVAYKGGAQLMPDLINGRVQLNIGPISGAIGQVNAGKLRMLASLTPQRLAQTPTTPTLAESGIAAAPLPTWQAIFAPPKTPRGVAEQWARELAAVLKEPAVRAQFDQFALQIDGGGPEALQAAVVRDQEVWRNFVRDYQIPQE